MESINFVEKYREANAEHDIWVVRLSKRHVSLLGRIEIQPALADQLNMVA